MHKPLIGLCGIFMVSMFVSEGVSAQPFIVKNGVSQAEIVVAENPPRLVTLGAEELRTYIEKISGADLPIVTAPSAATPVKLYVGRSAYTDKFDIHADDLRHGAYRMVSGPDRLVLLGHDADFQPTEPWPRSHTQYPKTQTAWEELYGGPCTNPMNWYGGPASSFNKAAGVWRQDRGGSLQAVYAFLRDLGVRWYMPGDIGEVVPEKQSIALPDVDRTVRPDFAMRNLYWYNRFHMALPDDVRWWLRLGLNDGSSVLGASMLVHGMRMIHSNETMKQTHPEYYALYRGQRDTDFRGSGHACFSSEGLFRETVRYIRAAFDHFDEPAIDLWPQDAYHQCGCPLCAGHSASDLVFGFVDRVAREVYKTHPERLVTCGAYAEYAAPPSNIDAFSPNVAITISNRGRPLLDMPARWEQYWTTIERWRAKLAPGHLIRGENNLYNRRLVIHPQAYARDLRALNGISIGDICEVPRGRPRHTQWPNPGINHLNYYVQSRLLWDTGLDLDALLDEYYTRFYGPAAETMKSAFEYAEEHYNRHRAVTELSERTVFVERLHAARDQVGDNIYGRRIQRIIDELRPLEELRTELKEQRAADNPREDARVAVARHVDSDTKPETYTFKPRVAWSNRETAVSVPTSFSMQWEEGALVFDIRCQEPDMANIATDGKVWEGDSVLVFLETPRYSHYMIQIAPDGRIFDAKRNEAGRLTTDWSSMAEVTTGRDDKAWWVRARIPLALVDPDEEYGDPLHHVVASKPLAGSEWFFNIGRTRIRNGSRMTGEQGYSPYAFSPTKADMHLKEVFPPQYFARLKLEPAGETQAGAE